MPHPQRLYSLAIVFVSLACLIAIGRQPVLGQVILPHPEAYMPMAYGPNTMHATITPSVLASPTVKPAVTIGPTATVITDTIQIINVNIPETMPESRSETNFQVQAYDKRFGTTDGAGIQFVTLVFTTPYGETTMVTDSGSPYCAFTGSCNRMPQSMWLRVLQETGDFTLTVTAKNIEGNTKTVTWNITKSE